MPHSCPTGWDPPSPVCHLICTCLPLPPSFMNEEAGGFFLPRSRPFVLLWTRLLCPPQGSIGEHSAPGLCPHLRTPSASLSWTLDMFHPPPYSQSSFLTELSPCANSSSLSFNSLPMRSSPHPTAQARSEAGLGEVPSTHGAVSPHLLFHPGSLSALACWNTFFLRVQSAASQSEVQASVTLSSLSALFSWGTSPSPLALNTICVLFSCRSVSPAQCQI